METYTYTVLRTTGSILEMVGGGFSSLIMKLERPPSMSRTEIQIPMCNMYFSVCLSIYLRIYQSINLMVSVSKRNFAGNRNPTPNISVTLKLVCLCKFSCLSYFLFYLLSENLLPRTPPITKK